MPAIGAGETAPVHDNYRRKGTVAGRNERVEQERNTAWAGVLDVVAKFGGGGLGSAQKNRRQPPTVARW